MNYTKRQDPYTGEEFIPRRYNQKFANRKNQVDYNNSQARVNKQMVCSINKILEVNRKILKAYLDGSMSRGKDCVIIQKEMLLDGGFDFTYMTQSGIIEKEHVQLLYEYGLIFMKDDWFKIKKFK